MGQPIGKRSGFCIGFYFLNPVVGRAERVIRPGREHFVNHNATGKRSVNTVGLSIRIYASSRRKYRDTHADVTRNHDAGADVRINKVHRVASLSRMRLRSTIMSIAPCSNRNSAR